MQKPSRKNFYAQLATEKNNPHSRKIDQFPISRILSLLNKEDQAVPKAVAKVKPQIAKAVRLITNSLKQGGRLFFAGAGTSGRLGVLEAAECPPTFGTSPSLIQAVMAGGNKAVFQSQEGAEDNQKEGQRIFLKKLKAGDALVGIAASGITPFVQGAFAAGKTKKCRIILVTCNPSLKQIPGIDCIIAASVGPEIITGSTRLKAGTATKLILNMLITASMIRRGKVYQNWMVDLQPKSKKLVYRGLRLIEKLGKVPAQKAEQLFRASNRKVKIAILMAKRSWDYKTALCALKKSNGFLSKAIRT